MTTIKLTRGYRLTEETLRALIENLVPGEIPPDAVMRIDYEPEVGQLFVGFTLLLDERQAEKREDLGDLRLTGAGAPIPTWLLGPEGMTS